jgi:hypothetical protein
MKKKIEIDKGPPSSSTEKEKWRERARAGTMTNFKMVSFFESPTPFIVCCSKREGRPLSDSSY